MELMPAAALEDYVPTATVSMELQHSCDVPSPLNQAGRFLKRRMEV